MSGPTSGGRQVALWAVLMTPFGGRRAAVHVDASFTACDTYASNAEATITRATYAVVPAQYQGGDLDPEFVEAARWWAPCAAAHRLLQEAGLA